MKKILKCIRHTNMVGVVYDHEEIYTIDDGSVSLIVKTTYYLDKFKNKSKEDIDKWVQSKIKDSEESVNKQKGCTFDYKYEKDVIFETILDIDEKSMKKSIPLLSKLSKDELYNKIRKSKEQDSFDIE